MEKGDSAMKVKSLWCIVEDDDGFDILAPISQIIPNSQERQQDIIRWLEGREVCPSEEIAL
jgi:hypothetical protein